MTLEESGFYVFTDPESDRCKCSDSPGFKRVREDITCSVNPDHRRVGRFYSDMDVVVPCSKPRDVLFAWTTECLVQDHVLAAMNRAGLTGFWTEPAAAEIKKTRAPLSVRQLKVSGWGGVVPPEAGVTLTMNCPGCGLLRYSAAADPEALIDPSRWDGSDFFKIWPLPYRFVTSRVKELFASLGFSGARFMKTFSPALGGDGFSTPRLRRTLPDDRAHEIGDPLGIY